MVNTTSNLKWQFKSQWHVIMPIEIIISGIQILIKFSSFYCHRDNRVSYIPLPPWTVTELKLSSVVLMVNGLPDPRACTWDLIPVVTSLLDSSVAAKFLALSSFCKELFETTVLIFFFNLQCFGFWTHRVLISFG